MKLIDLLVKELPKRGGWPDGAVEAGFLCSNTTLYFVDANGDCPSEWRIEMDYEVEDNDIEISKDQYESALAASQKPTWNGVGVPPVGCECECHVDEGVIHCIVVGYDFDGKAVVMRNVPARKYFSIQADSGRIKPLRSEAQRKRDAAVEAMQREADEGDNWIYSEYEIIYDAIAAGKIPGVKLDD